MSVQEILMNKIVLVQSPQQSYPLAKPRRSIWRGIRANFFAESVGSADSSPICADSSSRQSRRDVLHTGNKIACSIAILTFNSAKTLERALVSAEHFAQIIICDGGSTDETITLAQKYGALVIQQDTQFKDSINKISNFSGVRNQMLDVAVHPWFFYLDSDELLREPLVEEIKKVIEQNVPAAYWVPRKYTLGGVVVDNAATYPTLQMRFFHRDAVNKFIKTIHERIEVKPNTQVKTLHEYMLVPMIEDPIELRKKWDYYVELEYARRNSMSFSAWLQLLFENTKVSTLYFLRFIRNSLFRRGTKMPWALEYERHRYHWNLVRRLWQRMKF